MQIHSRLVESESQLHWTARVIVRACLLLSLWNLPFPWLHNHDLYRGGETVSCWLPTHLDQYHAGAEAPEQGWHWHFVYFGGERSGDPLKQKFPPQHFFIMGESADSLPAGDTLVVTVAEQLMASAEFGDLSSLTGTISPGSWPHAVALSEAQLIMAQSPRELTGVARC